MKLKIRTKILLGFLVLTLIILVVGLMSIRNMKEQSADFDRVANTDVPILIKIEEIRAKFITKILEAKGYLILGNSEQMVSLEAANRNFEQACQEIEPFIKERELDVYGNLILGHTAH